MTGTRGGRRPPLYLGRRYGGRVEFTGEGSLLTVGPPGTGKSRGVAVWNLLEYPGSMLVTDPKGQLAHWSAAHRETRLGHDVAVLDPFGVTTGFRAASVNPLDPLHDAVERGAGLRGEADRIAHILLPDAETARDPAWRQGGRRLIITALLYLAALRPPEERHLPALHRLLWQGDKELLNDVVGPMQRDRGPHRDALREYATDTENALGDQPRAFAVFREEARQAVAIFAQDEPCGRASLRSTVDLARLLDGGLTVYLVLPPHLVESHGRWMGLIVSHAIHAIARARAPGDCVFLLDEFPNLGPLPGIKAAVAQLREKGLRVWIFVQDIAQLEAVYGKADALNLRAQAEVLQVLGCRSLELAQYIERRGGIETVQTMSIGMPDPGDSTAGPRPTIGEIGMPVFPAATVLEMPMGKQILVRHGYPVIVADVELWTGG